MPWENKNIYKAARRAAGYTQERAAELLMVSVRSLAEYEGGGRLPPNDVVERMADCYGNIALGLQHIRETNALMARVVPELEERSVLEAAVRIYNRMRRFEAAHGLERLMAIAEDGEIDRDERVEFDAILEDLREIVKSGMELEVYCAGRS